MVEQKRQLQPDEKYLSISLGGKTGLKLALFKNRNKKGTTDPDFVGQIPIACWVSTKKSAPTEVKVDEIEF
jgi:hypothetical protein